MSPILNAFIEHSEECTYRYVLIFFFAYIFIYAWGYISVKGIEGGYSTIFMIGLYLLARYVRKYPNKYSTLSKRWDITIILGNTLISTILSYFPNLIGISKAGKFCDSYVCPFTIMYSLYMIILFSKLRIQSKVINWISGSCFAVYLLHTHISLFDYYKQWVKYIYEHIDGFIVPVSILVLLIGVFAIAIMVDQPRKLLWKYFQFNKC